MAHLTRQQVLQRAYDIYPLSGYVFQAVWWGSSPQVMCGITENGYGSTSVAYKPYVATECSGYVSWAWGLPAKLNTSGFYSAYSGNSISRYKTTGTIEEQFPGIVAGDALWRSGHIGIYVGNNTYWHASQTNWKATTSGHGMSISTGNGGNFTLCLKYDNEYSGTYDPDDPDDDPITDNFWDGSSNPVILPPDLGDPEEIAIIYGSQYTKRRDLMKAYRRF